MASSNTPVADAILANTLAARRRAAYEASLSDIEAVPEAELLSSYVEVSAVCAALRASLPSDGAMRAMPHIDLGLIEKLEQYALAVEYAHAEYLAVSKPLQPLGDFVAQVGAIRTAVMSEVRALVERGCLDGASLAERGGTDPRSVAKDVIALAALLRNNWGAVQGHTGFTRGEVELVSVVGELLISALAQREAQPLAIAEARLMRQLAFTLFIRAYDEGLRAVNYLRWQDADCELIAMAASQRRGSA